MHVAMCILCTGYVCVCVCVWGGGGGTDRQRKDHNILNFDFRNIRLPLHLWEPNYCISMGMSVYCLDKSKCLKVN